MQTLSGRTWKLVEAFAFDEEGHELSPPLGKCPMGVLMFEAERMIVAVIDGSSSLPTDIKRVFAAYSGRYSFDGMELVTSVDGASDPDLVQQQIRHIHFESPTRIAITPKNRVLGRDARLKLLWERIS